MLAISFTFLGGRYHGTPSDRHVNEGAVAWPPEPWRILRALIATWHHKVAYTGQFEEPTLERLIETLANELPDYRLPSASHSHTRHYMPQFLSGKTSLVFDAFAAVRLDDPLTVIWNTVDLPDDELRLLDKLLSVMGYLGRAESWVEAQRISDPPAPNCVLGETDVDTSTGDVRGELVVIDAAITSEEYQAIRARFLVDKKSRKKLGISLPETLLDALCVDTATLKKLGWNRPPASRRVRYIRPRDALRPVRTTHTATMLSATTAQFMVIGKPLPGVEDSVRIGELMRAALMSAAKSSFGVDSIPAIFSGHGLPKDNRHGHAFYLPWDSDNDGRIDRILIHVPLRMTSEERIVVENLNRLWNAEGGEWKLVLEGIGVEMSSGLLTRSREWISATPYLHPWHRKKNFVVEHQVRRECRERGLPEPANIELIDALNIKNRDRRPIHFRRFRKKRGLTQPDKTGTFLRLTFAEVVCGPLALGFGCHFGLGLFRPEN